MPELEKQLQIMRSRDRNPDFFPPKLNRVMLGKAEAETTNYSVALCRIADSALYSAIRWADNEPVFGDAAALSENLARWLPEIYADMLPLLHVPVSLAPRFWRVLVEEVFIPTFFLELCKARRNPNGNELALRECWYLPREQRGTQELPFQRVFQAWLNAAGLRGPEDVGKLTQSEANRKTASNWLKGLTVPYEEEINRFVRSFKEDTARFADAQEWKGRLAFAAAMQRVCVQLNDCFSKIESGYCFRLLHLLEQVDKDNVPIDCDQVLMAPKTFFVARMVYRRLKLSKEWQQAEANLPKSKSMKIERAVTRAELDAIEKQTRFEMNPGNLLLKFIRDEISRQRGTVSPAGGAFVCTTDDIFAHGVRELNQMLR